MTQHPLLQLFSKEKVVSSPILNKIGAQPFRILAARTIRNLRPYRPSTTSSIANYTQELNREGLVVIPDFLPRELFEQVQMEALSLINDPQKMSRQMLSGPNLHSAYDFDDDKLDAGDFPATKQFFEDKNLLSLFESGLHKKVHQRNVIKWLEWLEQKEGNRKADGQTVMHSDTYYDTYKAWLYLEDISLEQAPFAYVKRTQKVEMGRLRYDYVNSYQPVPNPSRRITEEEIDKRGLQETVVVCKANTLAIANTFGYHRRLEGTAGHSRLALYASVRFHPFSI